MSVRPSIFYMRKILKTSGETGAGRQCLFQWPATSYCHQRNGPSRLAGTDLSNSDTATAVYVWRGGGCIKNILYFIQIRHTDDFPSMGTRLV